MSMLHAWWEEFVGRIAGPDDKSMQRKVWNWIWPVLLALTLLLVGVWAGFQEAAESLPVQLKWLPRILPIAPYVLIAALMVFVWHAAIAYDRASVSGPIIWIGEFDYDKYWKMFDIPVKNAGSGEVMARIYVVDVRDKDGKRIPRIDDQIWAHWRGSTDPGMKLFGDKHGTAGVFIEEVDERNSMCPCLKIAMPGGPYGKTSIVKTLLYPIEVTAFDQQEEITLTLRVDFSDLEGKFIKSKLKKLSVTPVAPIFPDGHVKQIYRITPK
jgi:hypothetical protein